MLIYKAFNKTLETYGISGKAIAQAANASESFVSQFRRGKKGATDEMLDKLLGAMQTLAPGSRRYFCSLVAGESGREGSLLNAFDSISEEENSPTFDSDRQSLAISPETGFAGTLK